MVAGYNAPSSYLKSVFLREAVDTLFVCVGLCGSVAKNQAVTVAGKTHPAHIYNFYFPAKRLTLFCLCGSVAKNKAILMPFDGILFHNRTKHEYKIIMTSNYQILLKIFY